MNKNRIQEFFELEAAAAPLRAYLEKNYNPNAQVVVRMDRVTVMRDELSMGIDSSEKPDNKAVEDKEEILEYGDSPKKISEVLEKIREHQKCPQRSRQTVTRYGVQFRKKWHMPFELTALYGNEVEIDSQGFVHYNRVVVCQL